ncbi:MAG: tRNA-dihydrouridine synthase 3 [Cirrosporium novae-zelandiae]|nr:MAG: tRNA-dihydrouridine synthase 3 [Cirrosporium novae-zelandiae]
MQNHQAEALPANPFDSGNSLLAPPPEPMTSPAVPPASPRPEDSGGTGGEKRERCGLALAPNTETSSDDLEQLPAKRIKLEEPLKSSPNSDLNHTATDTPATERKKGVAPIKAEFLISVPGCKDARDIRPAADDDAAEATLGSAEPGIRKKRGKAKGQNTNRDFGSSRDEKGLCSSRANYPEFSPKECQFGEKCKFEHDLRKYLTNYKRADLTTFDGKCPIWSTKGKCGSGWKCRFVGSHMREQVTEDGRKELVLIENESRKDEKMSGSPDMELNTVNNVSTVQKMSLSRKKMQTPKADAYNNWLEKNAQEFGKIYKSGRDNDNDCKIEMTDKTSKPSQETLDNRAAYTEPPFLPSEKRRVYFGAETPVLAPLTTQGNLPFRRLCVALGAQVTYSEMAMSLPLITGQKSEWALVRAHECEISPPKYKPQGIVNTAYDNSRDLKFGAQIAAAKPWQALKATEILTELCPKLRVIDMNCGCPIDMIFRQGAGSALLDREAKLEKMLRGMNAVSKEVPITVKIRMGTADNKPTAHKLVDRLMYGGVGAKDFDEGPAGVAAITLHGRSRQQRYTRSADWEYISECAALIKRMNERKDEVTDTAKEADARLQAPNEKMYFLGNGDCYSHVDYFNHLEHANVDSVMIARGALIKPWIFEEIEQGQYLDKSATERLALVEQYVRYGLDCWGSDEVGVGLTRRFLLEWLSFTHRYVPLGLLEYLPPKINDRPPAFRGRNELETLLGSDNYKDWIKISEMFLGPAHKDFRFEPKHKSNSYEIEAEG